LSAVASLILNFPYIAPTRHWRPGTGKTPVLEIKGEDSEQNRAKRAALDIWVQAVNTKGGFGIWCWDVAFEPAAMQDIPTRHAS
jgi:type III restriction enzyme